MTRQPDLTDSHALELHRARARRMGEAGMFLQQAAAVEIQERLTEVNRRFTKPAVVTGFPEIWRKYFPDAVIVPANDVLALENGVHDLVIHAMALHWANDPIGQLVQSRRALQPDGLCIAACFGGQTLNELRTVLSEAEVAHRGGLSPRVLPMGEIRDLGGLLQRAGLALPVADGVAVNVTYQSALHLMQDLRAMGENNALAQRQKSSLTRPMLAQIVNDYATHFGTDDGRISATFETIYLTGWAPDESQQKPLRPGSAQTRLADALGTPEMGFNLPDGKN